MKDDGFEGYDHVQIVQTAVFREQAETTCVPRDDRGQEQKRSESHQRLSAWCECEHRTLSVHSNIVRASAEFGV